MRIVSQLVACVAFGVFGASAGAEGLRLEPTSALTLAIDDVPAPEATPELKKHWGDAGSIALNVFAGYASDFSDTNIVPMAVGISWFPIERFSIDVQAEAAYVNQPGPDAGGGGAAVAFRWHFAQLDWGTIYADFGVGLLGLTNDVPEGASNVVFTPRAGGGVAIDIGNEARFMIGARWFHISNAQTASENPGINALQGYVGVSFGF